jgi:hypothetical protein
MRLRDTVSTGNRASAVGPGVAQHRSIGFQGRVYANGGDVFDVRKKTATPLRFGSIDVGQLLVTIPFAALVFGGSGLALWGAFRRQGRTGYTRINQVKPTKGKAGKNKPPEQK